MWQRIIVLLYLVLTVIVGTVTSRHTKSAKAYDGNKLGLLLCVAAGAGEWLGGTATTGVAEYGYEYGLAGSWYTIANALGICFLASFFVKIFRSAGKITVSGIIGHFMGERSRIYSSILLIFVMAAVGISQMVAIGTIGESLLGFDSTVAILFMGTIVLLYTVAGGMQAVGYTNIMHMLVMYAGVVLALFLCQSAVGGFDKTVSELPNGYFNFGNIGFSKVSSWLLASVFGACVAQAGIQPILGAKDEKTAVKSSYWIAFIIAPFGILTAFLGMYAKIKFPDLADSKMALPTLLMSLNPIAGGMVMAAIFAAILSTASPIFLSCGTLFSNDVYPLLMKDKYDEKRVFRVSRLATLIVGLFCIFMAVLLYHSQKVLDFVYFAYSIRGGLFAILLLGICWKNIHSMAANVAMLAMPVIGLFWISYKVIFGEYPIHPAFSETYAVLLAAFLVTIGGSLLCRNKKNGKD